MPYGALIIYIANVGILNNVCKYFYHYFPTIFNKKIRGRYREKRMPS